MSCKGSREHRPDGPWVVCPTCFQRFPDQEDRIVPDHEREAVDPKRGAFMILGGTYN